MTESSVDFSTNDASGISEGGPIRVLHVDDDVCFLKTAKQCLEIQGPFDVDTALSVDEALEKMKKEEYDIVISDYLMLGKDGLQFLEKLKERRNRIPFILFTGKGREEIAIKALNLGADGYFNKMGSPETVYGELAHGIRQALERNRTKSALGESEERYRFLFTNMLNGYAYCKMIFDDKGKPVDFVYLDINDAFEELTGLNREDVIGKKVTETIPGIETAHSELLDIYGRVASTRKEEKFEIFFKPLSLFLSISVYSPKKGYFVAVFENITEHKKTEEALGESEERYRTLFQTIREGVVIRGPDEKILSANPAAAALLGYERPEELVGKSSREFYVDKNQRKAVLKELMKSGHTEDFEVAANKKDGTHISVSFSIASHSDKSGNILQTSIFRDITERKKAEEKLRFAEDEKRSILDSMTEAVVYYDLQHRILWANRATCDMAKRSVNQLVGTHCFEIVHRQKPCDKCPVTVSLRTGRPLKGEVPINDGRTFFISAYPVRNKEGRFLGAVEIATDITEREKTQQKLEILNQKLHVVGGLTRHDVRNKLSTVLNNAYLARSTLPKHHKALAYLEGIKSACEQATWIFDFATLYEKLGVEELTLLNVGKSVEQAVSHFSDLKDVEVINECHGLKVMADSLLSQLFYNMIDNSLKHGKKVSQIRIHFEEGKKELKLFYEDNGVGIPKAFKPKLFNEGFTTGNGQGYGLPLIGNMMEVYGWTIEEEGEAGKGAKFTVKIPKKKNGIENYRLTHGICRVN